MDDPALFNIFYLSADLKDFQFLDSCTGESCRLSGATTLSPPPLLHDFISEFDLTVIDMEVKASTAEKVLRLYRNGNQLPPLVTLGNNGDKVPENADVKRRHIHKDDHGYYRERLLEIIRNRFHEKNDKVDSCRKSSSGDQFEQYLHCLTEISVMLQKSEDAAPPLKKVIKKLRQLTGVDRCYYFRNHLSRDGKLLTSQEFEDCAAGVEPQLPNSELQNIPMIEAGLERWVTTLSSGKSIWGRVSTFPEQERKILEPQGIYWILTLPLHVSGKWYGFIGFDVCREETALTQQEIGLLAATTHAVSAALERSQIDKERRIFNRIMTRLAAAEGMEKLTMALSEETAELFEWDAHFFAVKRPEDERFRLVSSYDSFEGERRRIPIRRNAESPLGKYLSPVLEGKPVLINRQKDNAARTLGRFGNTKRLSASLMFVPVKFGQNIKGVISIQSYTRNRYSDFEIRMLHRMADVVSPVLERIFATQRSKKRDEQMRLIVESLPAVIFSVSRSEPLSIFITPNIRNLTGYHAREFEQKPNLFFKIIHRDDHQEVRRAFVRLNRKKIPIEIRFRIETREGKIRWIRERIAPAFDEHGHFVRYDGIAEDISKRIKAEENLRYAHRIYREAIENARGIPYRLNYKDGAYEFIGEGCEQILGISREELDSYKFASLVKEVVVNDPGAPRDPKEYVQAFQKGEVKRYRTDIKIETPNGEIKWLNDSSILIKNKETGEPVGSIGILYDVTQRKKTEEALRRSEERYALAVRGASDGLWDWNLVDNRIYYSPRWKKMLGYTEKEISEKPREWFERVYPDDKKQLETDLNAHLKGAAPHFENEHRIRRNDGRYVWVLSRGLAVRDEEERAYRIVGSQSDIHLRKLSEQQLLHDAFHDELTQLPNRALFMDRLEQALARARRYSDYRFGVVFLDLDRFKNINDSLGHVIGDQLLVAVSRRLKQCLRPGDTVARLGGDEFTLLLEDIESEESIINVTNRIQAELSRPFLLEDHEVFITASTGIAIGDKSYRRPEFLLRDADTAMYSAKARGRAGYALFDDAMHAHTVSMWKTEMDLRRAVNRGEFLIHYQPIFNMNSGKIVGFEALARWQHPTRGLIAASEFASVAEETSLMVPIGNRIVEESCRRMREWNNEIPGLNDELFMSVNLYSRQFMHDGLSRQIQSILDETNFKGKNLYIEITESVLMHDLEYAVKILNDLKKMNLRLLVDDFGTGYSSLSYLQKFPIDILKIDRTFVSKMDDDKDSREIVTAIITMSRNLGLDIIAEGIETRDQLELLHQLGCELGQGYYLAEPMNGEHIEQILRGQKSLKFF